MISNNYNCFDLLLFKTFIWIYTHYFKQQSNWRVRLIWLLSIISISIIIFKYKQYSNLIVFQLQSVPFFIYKNILVLHIFVLEKDFWLLGRNFYLYEKYDDIKYYSFLDKFRSFKQYIALPILFMCTCDFLHKKKIRITELHSMFDDSTFNLFKL